MKENRGQTIIVIIFCLLFVFALFFRTSIAVIVDDLMTEFTIPAASLGLMSSTFFYGYAAMQLPVGLLSDRIGIQRTVLLFGLLGVCGSLLFACSWNMQAATWGRLLTGMGTAGVFVPALKYLSLTFSPHIFASISSIISAVGCFGPMLAALPLALLVDAKGWRFPFFLTAALMFLLVIAAWHLIGRSAKPAESNQHMESQKQEASSAPEQIENTDHKNKKAPFWRHPVFWYFSFWAFLFYGAAFSFNALWGAAYLQDTFHLSRQTASTHLVLSSFGLIVGSLFWGVVSDNIVQARRPLILAGTCSFFLLWGVLLGMSVYPGAFIMLPLYFLLGFCSMTFILILSATKEFFPLYTAGTAMGAANALMLGGAAVFQGITGYLLDLFKTSTIAPGYNVIFIFYLVTLFVALVMVSLMPETFPGKIKTKSPSVKINNSKA